jgi:WD40 repeat protein
VRELAVEPQARTEGVSGRRPRPLAPRTRQYEAFISYSHAGDSSFAAELQRILNRIARPTYKWWQWWPPRVFRDQTNLAAAADLGAEIENALAGSDSFVLLASTQAAESPWVNREVTTWCATKSSDRLFIALTSGAIAWDDARGDFDRARTTAIPRGLRRVFETEPLWVDFTGLRANESLSRDPRFVDGAATLAAAIRGTNKDAIVGEDVRQHRRTKQLVAGAIGLLTLLTVLAGLAAVYALIQRNHADERARLAISRQLAAEAVVALDTNPEQSLALAARAATTAPTTEAENALRQALRTSNLRSIIPAGRPVLDVAPDPTGRLVAAALGNGGIHTWALQTGKTVATRRLAGLPVRSVQFSSDGSRLLGAGEAGVAVWSTSQSSSRPLAMFDRRGKPFTAAFSADGKFVATGDLDGRVRLWRPDTGALVDELRPPGATLPVTAVSFSVRGSRLAAASGACATVWTLSKRRAPIFRSCGRQVWAVALSPNGKHVATGDSRGRVQLWNVRTGGRADLNAHSDAIKRVAFSSDGKSLISASDDETARVWEAPTGRPIAELRGHEGVVHSAAFAPDEKIVVTGGQDGTIRTWSTSPDPVRVELPPPNVQRLRDIAFDQSGQRIVTASEDGTARIWGLPRARVLQVLSDGRQNGDWVESARFSRDGRFVVTGDADGTANVWRASSGALLATLGDPGPAVLDAAFSPDGQLVAAAGIARGDEGPVVRLWRWRQRKLMIERGGFAYRADGVAFARSGALLAAAGEDEVRVWRAGNGSLMAVFHGRGDLVSVAFDPSGELIAAGGSSGATLVWDLRSKRRVARLTGHRSTVTSVGFSSDGRYLVTAGHDGSARVWTVPGGDLVTLLRTRASELEGAAFAPNGRSVAVAGSGGRATVFDCAECRPLQSLVCLAAGRVAPEIRAREKDVFASCD